jgi:predicted MPP superfamily phosphohydrolase
MPSTRRPRPAVNVTTIALRAVLYLAAAWATLVMLASGLFPGAGVLTLTLAVYTTLPLLAFVRWRGWPFYPGAAFRLLVVRPFWYTQLILPLVAAAGLIGLIVGAPFGQALLVGALGYFGARRLVVRNVDAFMPGLAPEFDGLRIAQLSDLHVGPHTSRRFLQRVVEATQSLVPDVIAVTGDLIDDRAEDVAVYARALGALEAPLGVYMIPGNHDVYAGWDDVERNLRSARLGTVLVNETRLLHRGDATIAIVGTGDPAGKQRGPSRVAPDVERALEEVPSSATVIAFAHNPKLWPALAARGVALTLSGHTHYGQFALPRLGWSLASPFLEHAMGGHAHEDAFLYISPGTGYWGIPFRLGAPSEVTLVTLRRGESGATRVHPARAVKRRRRVAA